MRDWCGFLQYKLTLVLVVAAFVLYHYGDRSVALFFAHYPMSVHVEYFFRYLDILGEPQWYLLPCLGFMTMFKSQDKKAAAAWYYVFLSVLLVSVVSFSAKWLIGRARPGQFLSYGTYGFYPDWQHYNASFMSLPSGHAAVIFAFGIAMSMIFPRYSLLVLSFAALVSSSRIVLTWHYFSDVLLGLACALFISISLYKRMFRSANAQASR